MGGCAGVLHHVVPDLVEGGEIPRDHTACFHVDAGGHVGPYDTIDATYRLLGAWVAQHAVTAPGHRVREVYAVSYGDTADSARFRTEIHWPIEETRP